jgi:hypothetical protein
MFFAAKKINPLGRVFGSDVSLQRAAASEGSVALWADNWNNSHFFQRSLGILGSLEPDQSLTSFFGTVNSVP